MKLYKLLPSIILVICMNSYGDKKLNIVTSSSPLASIFYMITHNDANITYLAKNYGCPHDYQMQPSQINSVKQADIIAYIDKDFDGFMLNATSHNSKGYVMKFSDLELTLLKDSSGFANWHMWLNTGNVKAMLTEIYNIVARLKPEKEENFRNNYYNSIHLLDLLEKKMQHLDASKVLLLTDSLEYFFANFKKPATSMFLGNKQPTLQYVTNLRAKYNSNQVNCIVIDNHQSDEYYSNILGSKANVIQLNGENWVVKVTDEPHMVYYNQMQNMLNSLNYSCFGS